MTPALRRLPALARFSARALRGSPSLARHVSSAASIGQVLSSASAAKPLKDAVKFIRPAPEKPAIWTYRELSTHVDALAAGLAELGYAAGDRVMVLLPPAGQEYPVTVLAAAKLGVSVVVVPVSAGDASVDVDVLAGMLETYRPRALFVGKELRPAGDVAEEDGIVAAVNPLVSALVPQLPLEDAKGLNGFVPLTGRAFASAKFPYLEHVVQTSDTNMRGTVTFKSLLVYSGASTSSPKTDAPLIIMADSGETVSSNKILADAKALGQELSLSGDHTAKNGKVVIKPSLSERSTAAIVSAVMHESLWVAPGEADSTTVSQSEDALLV